MLTIETLSCSRGDRVLFQQVSFTVSPGQAWAVTGHNGCGKTTLLRAVCRLASSDSGRISWQGQDINTVMEQYLSQLLYIGHRNALKDELTPAENVLALCRLGGHTLEKGAIQAAIEAVGLGREVQRLPTRVLSEGQKRRVALARLWCETRLLWVLDEPFTALDARSAVMLRQRLEHHLDTGGMVLAATHEPMGVSREALREIHLG